MTNNDLQNTTPEAEDGAHKIRKLTQAFRKCEEFAVVPVQSRLNQHY